MFSLTYSYISSFIHISIYFSFRARAGGNLRFPAIWLAIGAGSFFLSLDHGQRYPDVMSLLCFRGCESFSKKPINAMKIGELPSYTNSYQWVFKIWGHFIWDVAKTGNGEWRLGRGSAILWGHDPLPLQRGYWARRDLHSRACASLVETLRSNVIPISELNFLRDYTLLLFVICLRKCTAL